MLERREALGENLRRPQAAFLTTRRTFRPARLRQAEQLCALALRHAAFAMERNNTHHQLGAELEALSLCLAESQVAEHVAAAARNPDLSAHARLLLASSAL